jgi:hypothetical protein
VTSPSSTSYLRTRPAPLPFPPPPHDALLLTARTCRASQQQQ